jgi:hypothetical protein
MSINDRERDFENYYVHDQEMRFRIEARRNKLLALWAAGKLGKQGVDADNYAQDVIRTVFAEPGMNDVFKKIRADFDRAGVQQSDHQIRRHMEEYLGTAETQIRTE